MVMPVTPNNHDNRTTKTIRSIIVALHEEGHISPIEQGFIGNRLQGTDVSEFIQARYEMALATMILY